MMKHWEIAVALTIKGCEPKVWTKTVSAMSKEDALAMSERTALKIGAAFVGKPIDFKVEVAEPEEIVAGAAAA